MSLYICRIIAKSFFFHLWRKARWQDRRVGGDVEGKAKQGSEGTNQNKNRKEARATLVYIFNSRHCLGLKDGVNFKGGLTRMRYHLRQKQEEKKSPV